MTNGGGHDAIVIGAGIVGAACADALARDGLRVLVLEAGFAGGGTTAAGMGHLVVMDDSPAQLALTAYSLRLWSALVPRLPARVEHERCGTLWVAENDVQCAALRDKARVYASAGVAAEILDSDALREAEPQLRPGLPGALLIPADAVIYPPAAALHLLSAASERGAMLLEGRRVDDISAGAVRCGSETWRAPVVVNATGAAASALTPGLPIVPRKGHLAITDRYPEFCRHQIVEVGYLTSAHGMSPESVALNIQPRATGQVLIGSSRELVGWDPSLNRSVLRRMLARAMAFLPAIDALSVIRTWTGFRPATPDALPLIGRWERVPGLWIAAGHEGLGITNALATGQIIADLVAGRPSAIDAHPFSPARVA